MSSTSVGEVTSAVPFASFAERALSGAALTRDEARSVIAAPDERLAELLAAAFSVREQRWGKRVKVCVLQNARSGLCPEDCGYCSQSKRLDRRHRHLSPDAARAAGRKADDAVARGARRYCMVTSGRGPSERDIEQLCSATHDIKSTHPDLEICVSRRADGRRPGASGSRRSGRRLGQSQPEHQRALLPEDLHHAHLRRPRRDGARRLAATYRRSGHRIKPVVAAILAHPALYRALDHPNMVKSPVVFVAGALRSAGQGIERDAWSWLLEGMGQAPFRPPSVAGWDWGTAWLSSNSMHQRFDAANYLLDTPRVRVEDKSTPAGLGPAKALKRARHAVGNPWTSRQTDRELLRIARRLLDDREKRRDGGWRQPKQVRADMCQRVLRQLLVCGPDGQVH